MRICHGYLHNPDDADDAAQETFTRAVAHAADITDDLGSYMRVTARNVCRDLLRRREVERRGTGSLLSDHADDPQDVVLDREQLATVLPQMSDSDLRLVALRFAGFSYDEIAQRLGTSLTCVSVGLTRARHRARHIAASLPTRAGVWVGVLSPWRHRGRVRSLLASQDSVLVAQYATIATGIALLTTPAGVAAGGGGATAARPARPAATGMSSPADLAGRVMAGREPGLPVNSDSAAPARALTHASHGPSTPTPAPGGGVPLVPTPRSTAFDSVAASPNYAQNHTAYASGWSGTCWCTVYFVTHDSGHSWQLLPAVSTWGGFGPGLLSVLGPDDRLLSFVVGVGLQVSTPGGTAFDETIPAGHAALVPGGRVVMLTVATDAALARYDTATMTVTPGPSLPPGFHADDLAYAGSPSALLVAGYFSTPDGWASSQVAPRSTASGHEVVLTCSSAVCTPQATLPFPSTGAWLVSPRGLTDAPEVAAMSALSNGVLVSSDSGHTWHELAEADNPGLATFVRGGDGEPDLIVDDSHSPTNYSATRFHGAGFVPAPFGGSLIARPWPLYMLAQLPDGRLLANVAVEQRGLLCSTDDGASWTAACP